MSAWLLVLPMQMTESEGHKTEYVQLNIFSTSSKIWRNVGLFEFICFDASAGSLCGCVYIRAPSFILCKKKRIAEVRLSDSLNICKNNSQRVYTPIPCMLQWFFSQDSQRNLDPTKR